MPNVPGAPLNYKQDDCYLRVLWGVWEGYLKPWEIPDECKRET